MRSKAYPKSYRQPKTNTTEDKMADLVDQITAFEDWQRQILPALQADVAAGMSTKALREKYAALVQARVISEALTNPDGSKALTAAADLLNRVEGKATEKKEIKHTLENLSEKEIDAVLQSELDELEDMQQRFEQ